MTERRFEGNFEATRRDLERLNRLYSTLSHINRAIVRAESPDNIFSAACRIAVEEGNLSFATIGLVEPRERALVPVAVAGVAPDLGWLPLGENKPDEATATASRIYQGRPCIVNDIRSDPRAARGRAMLEEAGIVAVASFPLIQDAAVVGILAVGIGEAGYFGDLEIRLLEEVADDIAFAMDVLRRDEKRLAGEAKMHYLAFYDARTGLPGRALFEERLAAACESHKENHTMAVLAIHLRRYHGVLQVLGQEAGAAIARAVATRIEAALPTAIVARIGESEFALALDDGDGLHAIEETAWRVHGIVAEGIAVDGQEIFVDPFIGIALHPQDGSAAEVLKAALIAAGKPPLDSGSCCRFFVAEMDRGSRKRLDLDTALRHAIARQEFELHFQPQVDLTSGRVVGAEALLRWQRPNQGLVMPGEFIPMLEETGLICAVGEWALFEACRTCRQWQDAGLPPMRMAVNLSARQFHETDVQDLVRRALASSGLEPHWLELEVTESVVLLNAETIIRVMRDLNALGVSQALDDFGTGYSSLSYLQRLPVKRLKIDRSFVSNITSNPNDAAIVRAVVGMAHSLGMSVIAEGVETEGQLGYLRGLACEEMQGHYFSPALTADDFAALLRDGRSVPMQADAPRRERVLLLVDDEPNILSSLRRMLRHTDIRVLATTSPREGFDLLASNPVGVVICDQRMPEMTGTEFLRRVKELYPATVRVVLSGYTDLNSVIDAVNRGAIYKFLTKPWQEDAMLESLDDAFHLHEMERENQYLSKQLQDLLAIASRQEPRPAA